MFIARTRIARRPKRLSGMVKAGSGGGKIRGQQYSLPYDWADSSREQADACGPSRRRNSPRYMRRKLRSPYHVAIVDGGDAATVIGLTRYIALCDDQGLERRVERCNTQDYSSLAFGTADIHSKPQPVVGRCELPLDISEDVVLRLSCLLIDSDVSLVIGKDALVEHKCIKSHDRNWLRFNVDGQEVR